MEQSDAIELFYLFIFVACIRVVYFECGEAGDLSYFTSSSNHYSFFLADCLPSAEVVDRYDIENEHQLDKIEGYVRSSG